MKLRIGRKNMRRLYLQRGEEPSDQDVPIGFAVDWHTAQALCALVNLAQYDEQAKTGEFENAPAGSWGHLANMARMANWVEPPRRTVGD